MLPRTLVALASSAVLASSARAQQLGFTELALTDPDLNSSPETDFWIASAAPADVDADGDLDLLVAGYFVVYHQSVEERLTLYRNDGAIDATTWDLAPVQLDASGLDFGAADIAWGDHDNDGDPDALVAGRGAAVLLENDAGTLVRTTTALPDYREDAGFPTLDQRSITWADADNDGDLDLLVPSVFAAGAWAPTRLLRNDGPAAGNAWTFTDVGAGLPIAPNAVSAWADLEADGDLDLLLGNVSPYGDNFLEAWRNDAGVLTLAASDLAFIRYGTADWGDVDGDQDLDVVVAGNLDRPDGTGETVVRILFSDGQGGYAPLDVLHDLQSPSEPWLDFSAVAWADYDSDADVDLLVSGEWLGQGEIFGRSVVYANTAGTFALASEPLPAPIAGNAGGAFTWFDLDGDGDLDHFVAGGYYQQDGQGLLEARAQLFRNDAIAPNAAPQPPNALDVVSPTATGATLTWAPATDDGTPSASLTYQLELCDASGGVVAERALPEPGNVGRNTSWSVGGLAPGLYRWTVRAVDTAFNASDAAHGMLAVGGGPGSSYCSGDGSLATPCPCGNSGESGHGCEHSRNSAGAALLATGTTSPDTLVLTAWGEPPAALSIFLQGDASQPSGLVFGDGVRCVAGTLKRLGSHKAGGGVVSYPAAGDPSISRRSADLGDPLPAGTTRHYQTYFRDSSSTFCGPARFNATSAVMITW